MFLKRLSPGISAGLSAGLTAGGALKLLGGVLLVGAVALALGVQTEQAQGAAFSVDSLLDVADKDPGDGLCEGFHPITEASICTLRAAVQEANALAGADTIALPMGVTALTLAGASEDAAATGDLDIVAGSVVMITGMGVGVSVVDGAMLDRVFQVLAGGTLTLSGLTVQNGKTGGGGENANGGNIWNGGGLTLLTVRVAMGSASQSGGGVYNVSGGGATINASTVELNSASQGGGLYNNATMTVTGGMIVGNTTTARGGGIEHNSLGLLNLSGAAVDGNIAGSDGGGLYAAGAGTVSIAQSSVSLNIAGEGGGGLYMDHGSSLSLTLSDVNDNTASSSSGGGLYLGSADVTIKQSTVDGNSSGLGGGIMVNGVTEDVAVVRIDESTISDNTANAQGGGLFIANVAGLITSQQITNSTISGNQASFGAGGIGLTQGDLDLWHVTIADHQGDGYGAFPGQEATLRSSIIAGNTQDCAGPPITFLGQNIDGDGSCALGLGTDHPGVNPLLGPLQNNGGPTATHNLLPGSPAIHAAGEPGAPPTDQRGLPRVGLADIGAVEAQNPLEPIEIDEKKELLPPEGIEIFFLFPEILLFGEESEIGVEVVNTRTNGGKPLGGFTMVNTLPMGFAFVRAEGEEWDCSAQNGTVACDYVGEGVAAGESAMVTLVVEVGEADAFAEGVVVEHCATAAVAPTGVEAAGGVDDTLPSGSCQPLRIGPEGITVEGPPPPIGQVESVEFHGGDGQFHFWSHGPSFASIFADAVIVWCWVPGEDPDGPPGEWISYVSQLGVTNFPLADGHVLWVVAPAGGLTIFVLAG